jgi:hypothetical protein
MDRCPSGERLERFDRLPHWQLQDLVVQAVAPAASMSALEALFPQRRFVARMASRRSGKVNR